VLSNNMQVLINNMQVSGVAQQILIIV